MTRAGMTLVELVVALVVTGLALAGGYDAYAALIDHRARVVATADGVMRAAEARRTLAAWLDGARLSIEEGTPPFRGVDGVRGDDPDDELDFVTTAPTPLGAGETVVRLWVARGGDSTRGLVAELRDFRGTRSARVRLEPHVTGLDVQYLSGLLGTRQWMPSWISSTVLPAGVRVTVSAAVPESLPPLLRRPLLVPLGGGR